MGVSVQRHVPATLRPGKRVGTHCTGAWVGRRASLDGCENSRPTGVRSLDRPVRNQSLYRLRCPCPYYREPKGTASQLYEVS